MPVTTTNELKSENIRLLQAYQQTPSAQLRNRLAQLNLGLVRKEAHRWFNQCPESYDDLIQVGCLGLIRAIERFDMSKGHAFSSFAVPYIRGEIQHYLRDKSPQMRIPRRWQALEQQAATIHRQIRNQLHRAPTDVEIAEALEISLTEWQEVKVASHNRSLLSLDAPVRHEECGARSLGELVPDSHYRSFQLNQEDQIRLQQALLGLEKRTCEILEFVFLYDLTQKETAELLGVSAVTISRQVKKGLITLRKLMAGVEE
jgi:RNA polymerase sigma-B factor